MFIKNVCVTAETHPHEELAFGWLENESKAVCFIYICMYVYIFMAQRPVMGLGLLIIEALQSHSDTTLGRTPLDECSARRRDLYLTIHNIHNRQTSMLPAGFEPTIPAT
jgi:hypothetical protein